MEAVQGCFAKLCVGVDSIDNYLSILSMVRAIEFDWQGGKKNNKKFSPITAGSMAYEYS